MYIFSILYNTLIYIYIFFVYEENLRLHNHYVNRPPKKNRLKAK